MTTDSTHPPPPDGETPGDQTLFYPNRQLLQPGLRAPVLLAENTRKGFRSILRQLFTLHGVHAVLVEPAAVTAASLLFGCQEFILGCHDLLLCSRAAELERSCERLLIACREFTGNLEGVYVLQQTSDELAEGASTEEPQAEGDPAAACSRLKGLAARLEDFFADAPFEVGMDLERLGRLQFALDDVYDLCTGLLESLYAAVVLSPARLPLARFCERCYLDVTQRLVPGHIVAIPAPGGPGEKKSPSDDGDSRSTGLMELLPELAESLR